MQVHKCLVKEDRCTAERLKLRRHITVGNLGLLLHDVAQLPGKLQTTILVVDHRTLNGQGSTTHGRPGQAVNHTQPTLSTLFLE